jgi:Uma2 family endonuclease
MAVDTHSVQPVGEPVVAGPGAPLWRLSVNQYQRMICAGILTDDDPVELLEGWLVLKMPKKPAHRLCTQLLRDALATMVLPGWYVDAQEPITTAESEPEPDVMIVCGARRDYAERHPAPADLALVVEVADTTLQRDRTLKQRVYARAGIPRYWIVNLTEQQVEVYSDPTGPEALPVYRERHDYAAEDDLPLILAGQEVGRLAVREFLS